MLRIIAKRRKWIEFVFAMTQKEIKARYKMAIFGFLWIFLNPLLQMLVIGFIFHFFVPIKTTNYFEFLFPGLLAWNFFSYTLTKNTPMYINERSLIQKAKFPREAIVLSIVLSNLFHFLIALVMFLMFEWLVNAKVYWWWCLLPLMVTWLTILTVGLSLIFSSLNVKWRDINFGVQALMPLWFYATPIAYSLDLLPRWLGYWLYLNPMTAIVEAFRWAIMGIPMNWWGLIISLVMTIIIFIVGVLIFKKDSPFFDDWV